MHVTVETKLNRPRMLTDMIIITVNNNYKYNKNGILIWMKSNIFIPIKRYRVLFYLIFTRS